MKQILLFLTLILVAVIAILNQIAIEHFLYWKFWWFDVMMHFLGGLWVGLTALWMYFYSGFIKQTNNKTKFIFIFSIISVLIVGIGWEIFEYLIDSIGSSSDTIYDLIMDILGAIIAATIFRLGFNEKSDKIEAEI